MPKSQPPNGISIVSVVFAQHVRITNTQTDIYTNIWSNNTTSTALSMIFGLTSLVKARLTFLPFIFAVLLLRYNFKRLFKRFLNFEEGHVGITEILKFLDLKIMAVASGVVEGERGRTPFLQIFFRNAVPPNDVRTRENSDTLAFPQIGLQRNAKFMVKVNSFVIKVKCLISYIVICICKSVIHRLKSNIVTALFTTSTSQCWFVT